MKKILIIGILIIVLISIQMITILPWWSFLLPIFFLGFVLPLEKWKVPSFLCGLSAGFLAWILSTFYFETSYNGDIMNKISKIISVSNYLIYGIIGSIGGILTGLAFYSGFLLRKGKKVINLELQKK